MPLYGIVELQWLKPWWPIYPAWLELSLGSLWSHVWNVCGQISSFMFSCCDFHFSCCYFHFPFLVKIENESNNTETLTAEVSYMGLGSLYKFIFKLTLDGWYYLWLKLIFMVPACLSHWGSTVLCKCYLRNFLDWRILSWFQNSVKLN